MIRLIDAYALIKELNNSHYPGAPYIDAGISIAIGKVCDAPTIEPEQHYDEWCDSCKEYDQEKHCCPRWNSVIKSTVEELKAAQSERKKGEWIHDRLVSTGGGTYEVIRCSECESYYRDVGNSWNYCPSCGAKMEI